MAEFGSQGDGGRPWLVKCDGKNYTSFDSEKEAVAYIQMHKDKAKTCPKKELTYAAKCTWTYEKRGD